MECSRGTSTWRVLTTGTSQSRLSPTVKPLPAKILLFTDNKAAYDVIKCPGATKRTVHFNRWLHYARDTVLQGKAEVLLVSTDDMMADGFTKPVDKTKFIKCRDYLMTKIEDGS